MHQREQRLQGRQDEGEAGQKRLGAMERQREYLEQTLLRLSGALQGL
jgi:hypothetical protein